MKYLRSTLHYSIRTLGATFATAVALVDRSSDRDLELSSLSVGRRRAGHGTTTCFTVVDAVSAVTANHRIIWNHDTISSLFIF